MSKFDMSDYVDVNERIQEFRKAYPEGTLQAEYLGVHEGFVIVRASAFRHDMDARPGTGLAWEPFPGRTPYTKDSELQNAETSAWGRAIVAVGAADTKRGIASANEVRNRQTSREAVDTTPPGEVTPASLDAPRGSEGGSGLVEVAPDPSSCIHPSRTTTATGKVRCIVCSTIIEGAA